ncbi:hypothetical protein MDOR_36400 [Mycolicibacterium doricum]|uniref:Secreted protein n=1 Tax=Mycolicibacterium doricum TaxID=126673 RepID=A0A7I7VYM4_9MYCO|nr:hypothetical protein MDOR_36400 [Mycolicibacterium doricum]
MNLKKLAATATMTGALGFAAVGLGAGTAQADPHCWWVPDPLQGPGPGCLAPPGHLNHVSDVPPGHWKVKPGKVNHW